MLIAYITTLIIVAMLLLCAVRVHMSFCLHRGMRAKVKTTVEIPRVERTPHLHDFIFSKY